MLKVRLDIFHALQRISRLLKKSRGAFQAILGSIKRRVFHVNLPDIKEASVVDVTPTDSRVSDFCGGFDFVHK